MTEDEERTALRRRTHDANHALAELAHDLVAFDGDAARAVREARLALFDAWTILCIPPDDHDDEDH